MFATFITLAVIGYAIRNLRDLAQQDGAKIIAALKGQSWTAEPLPSARPVIAHFSPVYRVVELVRPALRAAA